jgi:hypothetical protein
LSNEIVILFDREAKTSSASGVNLVEATGLLENAVINIGVGSGFAAGSILDHVVEAPLKRPGRASVTDGSPPILGFTSVENSAPAS